MIMHSIDTKPYHTYKKPIEAPHQCMNTYGPQVLSALTLRFIGVSAMKQDRL